MQNLLILLVVLTMACGAAASVTISLAPAYADDSAEALSRFIRLAVSPEPKRRSQAARPQGKAAQQVKQGSNASYWPRRMDSTPPRQLMKGMS